MHMYIYLCILLVGSYYLWSIVTARIVAKKKKNHLPFRDLIA